MESQVIPQLGSFVENMVLYPKTTVRQTNLCNIKSVMRLHGWHRVHTTIFKGLFKVFSRITFSFQGPRTREVILQIVQEDFKRTLRLELFAPPTFFCTLVLN